MQENILDLVPSVCNKVTSQSEFNIFGSLILTTTDNRKVAVSKQLASNETVVSKQLAVKQLNQSMKL